MSLLFGISLIDTMKLNLEKYPLIRKDFKNPIYVFKGRILFFLIELCALWNLNMPVKNNLFHRYHDEDRRSPDKGYYYDNMNVISISF